MAGSERRCRHGPGPRPACRRPPQTVAHGFRVDDELGELARTWPQAWTTPFISATAPRTRQGAERRLDLYDTTVKRWYSTNVRALAVPRARGSRQQNTRSHGTNTSSNTVSVSTILCRDDTGCSNGCRLPRRVPGHVHREARPYRRHHERDREVGVVGAHRPRRQHDDLVRVRRERRVHLRAAHHDARVRVSTTRTYRSGSSCSERRLRPVALAVGLGHRDREVPLAGQYTVERRGPVERVALRAPVCSANKRVGADVLDQETIVPPSAVICSTGSSTRQQIVGRARDPVVGGVLRAGLGVDGDRQVRGTRGVTHLEVERWCSTAMRRSGSVVTSSTPAPVLQRAASVAQRLRGTRRRSAASRSSSHIRIRPPGPARILEVCAARRPDRRQSCPIRATPAVPAPDVRGVAHLRFPGQAIRARRSVQKGAEPMTNVATTGDDVRGAGAATAGDLTAELEQYRPELTGYCYRMLGSGVRGRRRGPGDDGPRLAALDRFEGRSSLRSWLYRIATNVCLDMLSGAQRRARPMDLGPSPTADAARPAAAREPLGAADRRRPRCCPPTATRPSSP